MLRVPRLRVFGALALMAALVLPGATTFANGDHDERTWATYEITLENLTSAQVFSPPLFLTHRPHVRLFQIGKYASDELRAIAEDGNNGPAAELASASERVFDVAATSAPVPPGQKVTVEVIAPPGAKLSLASMLVQTNDGFTGADRIRLPRNGTETYNLDTYDAGTEANNERAAFIPGPPFGGTQRDPTQEPITHHHGIQGGADLDPAVYNWTDPSARLTVTRVDNWITYQVTLKNLTSAQVFSPPLFVAHTKALQLFTLGYKASDELRVLAEDGNNGPLSALLADAPGVFAVQATSAPLPPGQSVTVTLQAPRGARLSLASMLVQTNDGFAGVDSLALRGREREIRVRTYDAGTEANNELADFVPGPPFGGTQRAPTSEPILRHPGILGVGDVDKATYDWKEPSGMLTIEPVTSAYPAP